jgi:two-component system sensor histidine kinase PilS (NtrC family)
MVSQNAQRLAKIVDEILNISRAQVPGTERHGYRLMLDETVMRIASDWTQQAGAAHLMNVVPGADKATVAFDPEHLRRVMINLLDNALRYASQTAAAIEVSTRPSMHGQAQLCVWSDGQPLEKTVQTHLFEPFFSSESRSSGLGLYICRELCERYGALIGYQRAMRHGVEGNEFFVLFKSADQVIHTRPATTPSTRPLPFDTLST